MEEESIRKSKHVRTAEHTLPHWPRAGHLSVPPPLPGRVVGLQDARLRLVCLGEGVATLLAHALHLPDLADGFLELFHSGGALVLLTRGQNERDKRRAYRGL
jgi:hypothetical protein